jgi:hypothetical protein
MSDTRLVHLRARERLRHGPLGVLLGRINRRRFGGLLLVHPTLDDGGWHVRHGGRSFVVEVGKRRLTLAGDAGDWFGWVLAVFVEEVAARLAATVQEQGVRGRRTGDPTRFPTVRDWLESVAAMAPEGVPVEEFVAREMSRVPGAFRDQAGG